jgi:hypothetical protein
MQRSGGDGCFDPDRQISSARARYHLAMEIAGQGS